MTEDFIFEIIKTELFTNKAEIFKETILNNEVFKNYFIEEFSQNPLIPSLRKFRESLITDKELSDDWHGTYRYATAVNVKSKAFELHKYDDKDGKPRYSYSTVMDGRLREIENDFYILINNEKLPQQFYVNDITKCNIYIAITKLGETLSRFKTLENLEISESIESYCENYKLALESVLKSLNYPDLTTSLINRIIEDSENIPLMMTNSHLLKKYEDVKMILNNKLETLHFEKAEPPLVTNIDPRNRTKEVILECFTNINNRGWEYVFRTETDYHLYVDLLTNLFEDANYSIPSEYIVLKKGCKTKVASLLGNLHRELSNVDKLKEDYKYFELIKILSPFKAETKEDIYKALTR